MIVSQGGVDTCLQVIKAHEKDPGFKKALEVLKKSSTAKKKTEKEVAEQEARLDKAAKAAQRKERTAANAVEKAASAKEEVAQRESELELARQAFNEDMARKQADLATTEKAQKAEAERLRALDGHLKHLQGELQQKTEKLERERAGFEEWRNSVRSALQKPAKVA